MKKTRFTLLLILEAAFFGGFYILQAKEGGLFSSVTAFPLEQIGWGLRALSLSGGGGNLVAVVLYLLICLIPSGIWLLLKKRKRNRRIDLLLHGITALLFPVLYYMVNPGLFSTRVSGGAGMMLGGSFYSMLLGYLVLRVLSSYGEADAGKLQRGLKLLLVLLTFVFVYGIFGGWKWFLDSISQVSAGNMLTGSPKPQLTWTYAFLGLRAFMKALPCLMDIGVVFLALCLLEELKEDRYSDRAVTAAQRLAAFCRKALTVTVILGMFVNLTQLAAQYQLYQVEMTLNLPVLSVIFTLAALLLARYIQEGQRLKREHDLFI